MKKLLIMLTPAALMFWAVPVATAQEVYNTEIQNARVALQI